VTEDIEAFKFNTAISQLMILVNEMEKLETISISDYKILITILAPFAPHIADELWEDLGNKKSIYLANWPKYTENKIKDQEVSIAVQVNGKIRGTFEMPINAKENEIKKKAFSLPFVKKWTEGKDIKKTIIVPNKLVSIVTS